LDFSKKKTPISRIEPIIHLAMGELMIGWIGEIRVF